MLAGIQGRHPDALVARVYQVAVFELNAADVFMRHADERDHHADVPDGDVHHRHLFHLHEPRIQVPRAGEQDLFLQTAPAAAIQKRLGVLEVFVSGDHRSGDFTGLNRPAVQRGDDADHVRLHALQQELLGGHAVVCRAPRGDDREQRGVDAVRARREQAELPAFLAAVEQELPRILEFVAIHELAQDVLGRHGRAIRREHQRDLALRHDRDGHLEDAILPRPVTKVQARREGVRLVTGFAVEGDEPSGREAFAGESFDNDPHLAFTDQDQTGEERQNDQPRQPPVPRHVK